MHPRKLSERSLSWLDSVEEPFFLWNHYMDPHGPYAAPAEYQTCLPDEQVQVEDAQEVYWRAAATDPESITKEECREMLNCYDEEIQYVDAQVAAFLDRLEERGVLSESLVILTADHGDLFGEDGYYGHPRRLHDGVLRVPMLLIGENVPDVTIESPVSTLDVVPTVPSACGIEDESLVGESLQEVADVPEEYAE